MHQQEQWQLSDDAAALYERYLVPLTFGHWAVDLVDAAGLRSGERMLDVACGTGAVARVAAERVGSGGRVVGLDLNAGMLAVARSVTAAAGLSIAWCRASALGMPFADGAFDLVFCQQGLQFFPDRAAGLREMHRVLAPGGRLALGVWRAIEHNPDPAALAAALERQVSAELAATSRASTALGDAAALRALVIEAGFREVSLRADTKVDRWPSLDEYLRIRSITSPRADLFAQLDAHTRAALASDLGAALRPYLDGEQLLLPWSSHTVVARR